MCIYVHVVTAYKIYWNVWRYFWSLHEVWLKIYYTMKVSPPFSKCWQWAFRCGRFPQPHLLSFKLKDKVSTSMWKRGCVNVSYSEVVEKGLLSLFFKINEVIVAFLKLEYTVIDFYLYMSSLSVDSILRKIVCTTGNIDQIYPSTKTTRLS